jgi:serine/threonine protein kinase
MLRSDPLKEQAMPAPATVDEFLDLVSKSGVADQKRLDAFLNKANTSGSMPEDPNELANVLVREGILTHFQTQQLVQGKWRGFAIGHYKVLERLGSGGMGNVYLCEHKVMRKRVAIKVLATVSAENPESLKRFYREARAAAALDHPHIVRAHDVGKEEKLHYLVMDYVDGNSLEYIVRTHGPMDFRRAAHYVAQAATGLQFAHATGLVHRDIKPANLILDRTGTVKVLDMGVARFYQEDDEVLTKGPLGTADYLAPEQAIDSHNADLRADVYGLGGTFYFLLTGTAPFSEGKTVAQKIMLVQTQPPRPVEEFRKDVPPALIAVIDKMMAKKPDQRYQRAAEIVEALQPWTSTPILPPPDVEMPHLSPAAQGNDGTDVNIGMTPVGNVNTPSSRMRAAAAPPLAPPRTPAATTPAPVRPAAGPAQTPAPPARARKPARAPGAAPATSPEFAPATESEEESEDRRSNLWVVLGTFVVAACIGVGIWWMFLRGR